MKKTFVKKMIYSGRYVAQVEVEMLYTDEGWSPYISLEDAQKMEAIRAALQRGDLKAAARLAVIFSLTPVET